MMRSARKVGSVPGVSRACAGGGRRRGLAACPIVGAAVAAFCLVVVPAATAGPPGEDPLAMKDAIGRGVHAFHGGDFDRAYDALTNAIEAGTADPRAFYFRGLAALRLGRTAEADADFAAGADREVADGGTHRISRSLERVQGCDRVTLERFRARARLAVLQRDNAAAARRYSTIEDPASGLLRRRRPEDVDSELLPPRRGDGVEEVPAPPPAGRGGRAGKPFADEGDEPAADRDAKDADADGEKEMAAEPEEEMADEDAKDPGDADAGK